jgi:hypothetical protein
VYVTADGRLILSLLRAASVIEVDHGALGWVLAGDGVGVSTLPPTMIVQGDAAFEGQHDPSLVATGDLLLLDNGHQRGLELALDPVAGSAAAVDDWPLLGGDCHVEGSVAELPDGHHLLTCQTGELSEYDGEDALVAQTAVRCASGPASAAVHGLPMDLWSAHVGTVTAERVSP